MGEQVSLDSLDLMDLEMLDIGDDCVIGPHVTIIGHTFAEDTITFSKVGPPRLLLRLKSRGLAELK